MSRITQLYTISPSQIDSRSDALNVLASCILKKGYKVKGGYVRDHIIFGEKSYDIDICSGCNCQTEEGVTMFHTSFDALVEHLRSEIKGIEFLTDVSWRSDAVCSIKVTHQQNRNWIIELQYIAKKHIKIYPVADLTCNNLALILSASGAAFDLMLAGESHLNLLETLAITVRKEFGIQSGSIIPRVLRRAAFRKVLGWIQIAVPPVGKVEDWDFSENEKYIKSKGLMPTNEHPVSWSHETAWLMVQEKCAVDESLKRKREEKEEEKIEKKRAKWRESYPNVKQKWENCEGNFISFSKQDWLTLIYYEFPTAKNISVLKKESLQAKYEELVKGELDL
jgi:hypothetical protein